MDHFHSAIVENHEILTYVPHRTYFLDNEISTYVSIASSPADEQNQFIASRDKKQSIDSIALTAHENVLSNATCQRLIEMCDKPRNLKQDIDITFDRTSLTKDKNVYHGRFLPYAAIKLLKAEIGDSFGDLTHANILFKKYSPESNRKSMYHYDRAHKTVLIYLNTTNLGKTVFPKIGCEFSPKAGNAISWLTTRIVPGCPAFSEQWIDNSLHGGNPVTDGENKYIITIFFPRGDDLRKYINQQRLSYMALMLSATFAIAAYFQSVRNSKN
jgi:hypothetical protein